MKNNQALGRLGEQLAAKYLQSKGYKIVARNFRTRNGELDLVTLKDSTLICIEVKTRVGNLYGTPLEAIGFYKLQALIRTVAYFQLLHPDLPQASRLDAIAIELTDSGKLISLQHIPNITQ